MTRQRALRLPVGAPQPHIPISAASGEQVAILSEGDRHDRVLMPFELGLLGSLVEVPELGKLIAAGRRERLAVG